MSTFGWDYPPGVTGNEFAITGPLEEWDEQRDCDVCERETTHACWYHPERGAWAECTECGNEVEVEGYGEPDPDESYDRMREDSIPDD